MSVLNRFDQERQAFLGVQAALTIDSSTVSTIQIGSALLGQALPNGTYTCLIDILGLVNKLTLLLKATIGAGSVTTSGGTTMLDKATIITAFGGVGAMVTATRQTVTLTPITGEKFALLTIVVAGGGNPTFTEAEIYGN